RNYIENDLGDTIDVEDGRPSPGIDWEVTIDREAAAKYGIGVRELSPYVQLVTSGVKLGAYRPNDADDELDIRVRLPLEERSFDSLDSLRIVTAQGLVPVSNFIKREAVPKVANISRKNGKYQMAVAANFIPAIVQDPSATQAKMEQLGAFVKEQNFPATATVVFGGADEQIGDTNAFIGQALMAALFIIFLVLLLEYNSFYQVLVTLSTVLMSLAGVMVGMVVTGMSFSAIMTGLGIVALAGIVVKNGIVLIDTYNHYNRDEGVDPVKAMLITASQRVRPVLLTATVTALGVIPMALNIEFDFIRQEIVVGGIAGSWFTHLSAALVSGLFVSTALTLVMVPVMITAPSVIRHGWIGRLVGTIAMAPFRLFGGRKTATAVTPEGAEIAIPADIDSSKRFIKTEGSGLVETEQDGVTVVSRQAAE
ncbi:efflux RND transporter permease subunit, partial [Devosia sp.]|uniref:efflux RND transporter permease subunit n=1 Tax=Devosia sp. TaxID=1871048 RepID=UPI0035AFD1F4